MKLKALCNLKRERGNLTSQQFRTLKGQILAGDVEGAEKGLAKLLRRQDRCEGFK